MFWTPREIRLATCASGIENHFDDSSFAELLVNADEVVWSRLDDRPIANLAVPAEIWNGL